MTQRQPGQPGYMGPQAEAERAALIVAARMASPKRTRAPQDAPATLPLFAPMMEPGLF